jgi:hypothetical protein
VDKTFYETWSLQRTCNVYIMFLSYTATSICANVWKFWEYFAAACRDRKICFRRVISSRSYSAIFIRNETSSNDLGKYIRVFQTQEIYKINEHILENLKYRKLLTFDKNIHVYWNKSTVEHVCIDHLLFAC